MFDERVAIMLDWIAVAIEGVFNVGIVALKWCLRDQDDDCVSFVNFVVEACGDWVLEDRVAIMLDLIAVVMDGVDNEGTMDLR